MSGEMKPCPFCNGRLLFNGGDDAEKWKVCDRCGAEGPIEGATKGWNTRALLPALQTVREAMKDGVTQEFADAVYTAWGRLHAAKDATNEDARDCFLSMLDAEIARLTKETET